MSNAGDQSYCGSCYRSVSENGLPAVNADPCDSKASENGFHLSDLARLRVDDAAGLEAEVTDLRITDRCLAAHQDGARVMRDHRAHELLIADQCLRPNGSEGENEYDAKSGV